jgi:hypothetical protein
MKVSELIQRLQQTDPQAQVLLCTDDSKDSNRMGCLPITEIKVTDGTCGLDNGCWVYNVVPTVWLG